MGPRGAKSKNIMLRTVALLLLPLLCEGQVDPVVPHMAQCDGTTDQLWQVSRAGDTGTAPEVVSPVSVQLQLAKGGCLLPGVVAGTNTAFVGKCGGGPQWIAHSDASSMWFEAMPGRCLGLDPHVWPVPDGRNYLVQLTACPGTKWTRHHPNPNPHPNPHPNPNLSSPAPLAFQGRCLDGGLSAPAPAPIKCCEGPSSALPFCNASASFAQRAAALEARLRSRVRV